MGADFNTVVVPHLAHDHSSLTLEKRRHIQNTHGNIAANHEKRLQQLMRINDRSGMPVKMRNVMNHNSALMQSEYSLDVLDERSNN